MTSDAPDQAVDRVIQRDKCLRHPIQSQLKAYQKTSLWLPAVYACFRSKWL